LKVLHLQIQFDAGELPSLLRLTPLLTDLITTLPSDEDISAFIFDGTTPPLVPLLDQCVFLFRDDHNPDRRVETIQAIRLFASSRCDLLDNATSTETALPSGGFHPLTIFRICFGSRPNRYRQYFEGWVQSDMSDELCKQRGRLVAIIPELRLGWYNTSFKRKFNLKWKKVVIGLLSHLETLKVEKVSDIGISEIYPIIYSMGTETDVGSSFRVIAERILHKWEPIIRGDMGNIRWVSSTFSLIYLLRTERYALHTSLNTMNILFHGLGIGADELFE